MNKSELRAYRRLKERIRLLAEEREDLLGLIRTGDGIPSGQIADPTGTAASRLADVAARMEDSTRELLDRLSHIETVLETLPDTERNIMYDHYIRGKTWEQVAEDMGFETPRHLYNLQRSALEKLEGK